jgi:hypothetical protein
MRIAVWIVLVIGCDAGAPPPRTQKAVPAGPYVVHYDCFHSDQPFGTGSQYRNVAYDLGAKKVTLVAWETKGNDMAAPPPAEAPPPPTPVVSELGAAHVARMEEAVGKVLRGGPYKPEYPVPEGTPCTLRIEAAGTEVFKLEKADTTEKDAASELVLSFAAR